MNDSKLSSKVTKGALLELRVGRLLAAEGLSPWVNVYFRRELDPRSVNNPDVDVMGCRFLADASCFFTHYDCKSGDSEVVSRILMLLGLRSRIPGGPIVYVRRQAPLDLKHFALAHGIRLASVSQFEERERRLVTPTFGNEFPGATNPRFHENWSVAKGRAKRQRLGGILRYLDGEFWAEPPFTRLRRCIAACEQAYGSCIEAGIVNWEGDAVIGGIIRHFTYALLAAVSHAAYFSTTDLMQSLREWLITERLPVREFQSIIESAVQLTFDIYGDPAKGPLRRHDYAVPPPEYTEALHSLIVRTVELYDAIPWLLPTFDAAVLDAGVLEQPAVGESTLTNCPSEHQAAARRWLRTVRLFLGDREPNLAEWQGWRYVLNGTRRDPVPHNAERDAKSETNPTKPSIDAGAAQPAESS